MRLNINRNKAKDRYFAAEYIYSVTDEQIKEALNDKNIDVRNVFLKRFVSAKSIAAQQKSVDDGGFINKYIDSAFKSGAAEQMIGVLNADLKITETQLDVGLKSESVSLRRLCSNIKYIDFTPKQIEDGLTDIDSMVRYKFALLSQYTPTRFQIERGLLDKNPLVRWAFSRRIDAIHSLTQYQIKRGLADKDKYVRAEFFRNSCIIFNDTNPNQVEIGLTDISPEVRRVVSQIDWVKFTPEQINRGLGDKDDEVRVLFSKRTDFTPNKAQIDKGIRDSYHMVIYNFLHRDDITLTTDQIEYSLTHESLEIQAKIKERKEYSEHYKKSKDTVEPRKQLIYSAN